MCQLNGREPSQTATSWLLLLREMEEQKYSFVTIIHERQVICYRAPSHFSVSHNRFASAGDVCNQMFNFILAVVLYQSLGVYCWLILILIRWFDSANFIYGGCGDKSTKVAVVDFNPFWDFHWFCLKSKQHSRAAVFKFLLKGMLGDCSLGSPCFEVRKQRSQMLDHRGCC